MIMCQTAQIRRFFKGIIDSTLREGCQFRSADFALKDMEKIFFILGSMGIDYIEVGNPAAAAVRSMLVPLLRDRPHKAPRVLSHIRNHSGDLRAAADCGVDGINILCSVDPDRLSDFGINRMEYLQRLQTNIRTAAEEGLEVRFGIEAFFEQPLDRCMDIIALADSEKISRLCFSDTLGSALNWEVYERISHLRSLTGIDFEVHLHNDLGHAVSNALTALAAGANWVDTSLLGIGERTGITPLSTLLINLHLIDPGLTARYELHTLTSAENYVSALCGIETPVNLPTNTQNGFAHKAGIHLDAILSLGPEKYEPLDPELIGNQRNLIVNTPISGKTTAGDVHIFEMGRKRPGSKLRKPE